MKFSISKTIRPVKIKTKAKTIQNPWLTKGIAKSFKKEQKLYEWFLKRCTPQNEQKYKKERKKIYYSNKLLIEKT